mmetsp:Transcript_23430/g.36661  ORF Transcript_23430/g.36661 Transcript_23430/m.36661 type:complete len:85 (+) Transcript_23430:721-975(+)
MQVVKGGHKTGRTCTHICCVGGTWYTSVEEKEMKETLGLEVEPNIVTCEVPKGDLLFMGRNSNLRMLSQNSQKAEHETHVSSRG